MAVGDGDSLATRIQIKAHGDNADHALCGGPLHDLVSVVIKLREVEMCMCINQRGLWLRNSTVPGYHHLLTSAPRKRIPCCKS
jgi:hypothetical protein